MEKKLNNCNVVALSLEEEIEINAGSERHNEKQINWFEKLWTIFIG